MIFRSHCRYQSQFFCKNTYSLPVIIPEISYIFKDYRGLSEWNESYIWCYCFDSNDYNYFNWSGSQ